MASYRFLVQQISGYFEGCEFLHIRRDDNEVADMLSKLGSSHKSIPPEISLEHLRKPSIKPDPNSLSIFIREDAASGAIPVHVDKGKGKAVLEHPRIALLDPGSAQTHPGTAPTHPGITPSDPGTSQSLMI